MIGGVTLARTSSVMRRIVGLARSERAQSKRRQQTLFYGIDDCTGGVRFEKRYGKDLIRAKRGIVGIGDVEQVSARGIPKLFPKRLQCPLKGAFPARKLQGLHPEGLNLHRFADTRRDYPIADLCVHPSELYSGNTGGKQAVRVHVDAVARAGSVAVENRVYRGHHRAARGS